MRIEYPKLPVSAGSLNQNKLTVMNDNKLLIATDESGSIICAILEDTFIEHPLHQALVEHYDSDVTITSISEKDKNYMRTCNIHIAGETPYDEIITLTPAYLYK